MFDNKCEVKQHSSPGSTWMGDCIWIREKKCWDLETSLAAMA